MKSGHDFIEHDVHLSRAVFFPRIYCEIRHMTTQTDNLRKFLQKE